MSSRDKVKIVILPEAVSEVLSSEWDTKPNSAEEKSKPQVHLNYIAQPWRV